MASRRKQITLHATLTGWPEPAARVIVLLGSHTGDSTEEEPKGWIQFRFQGASGTMVTDGKVWAEETLLPILDSIELPKGYAWVYSDRMESGWPKPDPTNRHFSVTQTRRAGFYISTSIGMPRRRDFLKFAVKMLKRVAIAFDIMNSQIFIGEVTEETHIRRDLGHAPVGASQPAHWTLWVPLATVLSEKYFR